MKSCKNIKYTIKKSNEYRQMFLKESFKETDNNRKDGVIFTKTGFGMFLPLQRYLDRGWSRADKDILCKYLAFSVISSLLHLNSVFCPLLILSGPYIRMGAELRRTQPPGNPEETRDASLHPFYKIRKRVVLWYVNKNFQAEFKLV